MTQPYVNSNSGPAKRATDVRGLPDHAVMQALVTAGALVALADGRVDQVERDELTSFIARQDFVPGTSSGDVAAAFDDRVRDLTERYDPNTIVDALRPLAGRSLTSIIIGTAERVAAADRKIHPGEQQAIELLRQTMMTLPASPRPMQPSVFARPPANPSRSRKRATT